MMICPKCGNEMDNGFVVSTKDGALSFANEVPGIFENAKKTDGYVKLTGQQIGHRTNVKACCCDACRMIIIPY